MQFTVSTESAREAAIILEALNNAGVPVGRPALDRADPRRTSDGGWADDPDDNPPPEPPQDDPWAEPGERQPQRQQRPAEGSSGGGSKVPRSGTHEVDTPKGTRYWTFGLSDAPVCECGLPAARQTPSERPPFDWARWTCPLAFSKDTYKGKCSFNQWAEKKK